MNREIFTGWYEHVFIPEVEEHQSNIGKGGKVLLLLDNAPSHPQIELLDSRNGKFTVVYLPPNVTAILQPMDQGAIEVLKRLYRKQLMLKLFSNEQDRNALLNFSKTIDVYQCCYMLAEAWASVEVSTLRNVWNKLMPHRLVETLNPIQDLLMGTLEEHLRQLPGFEDCDSADVEAWLTSDCGESGQQILTDDEIIEEARAVFCEDQDSQEESQEEEPCNIPPTAEQAAEAFDTALRWLECQERCDPTDLVRLSSLRALASTHGRI